MIFNVSELGSVNFSEVLESSINTVRKSIDGTQTFVKWDDETIPPSVDALTTKDGPHLYEDMLAILSTSGSTNTEIVE